MEQQVQQSLQRSRQALRQQVRASHRGRQQRGRQQRGRQQRGRQQRGRQQRGTQPVRHRGRRTNRRPRQRGTGTCNAQLIQRKKNTTLRPSFANRMPAGAHSMVASSMIDHEDARGRASPNQTKKDDRKETAREATRPMVRTEKIQCVAMIIDKEPARNGSGCGGGARKQRTGRA